MGIVGTSVNIFNLGVFGCTTGNCDVHIVNVRLVTRTIHSGGN